MDKVRHRAHNLLKLIPGVVVKLGRYAEGETKCLGDRGIGRGRDLGDDKVSM